MKQKEKQSKQLQQLTGQDFSDLDPDMQKVVLAESLKSQGKQKLFDQQQRSINEILNQNRPNRENQNPENNQNEENQQGFNAANLSDADIQELAALKSPVANIAQHQKDVALREQTAKKQSERKEFESERKFHTDYSKGTAKEADSLRATIPRKESALNFARQAVESADLSYFSPDKLADSTGIDLFRSAKGAQLVTAGKENLLSNMSKVGAKAQNIWFEQRLNSMFPKIGQSEEANLTVQEMLEGEVALDKAYLTEYDRIVEQDEKDFGYERKDSAKRAYQAIKPLEKHIFQRASYRMKEIEEKEQGLSSMKKAIGKNVAKGTPLTLAMTKLYLDKFGDKALEVAEKNGYQIPTYEEYKSYQQAPQEFREEL